MQPNAGSAAIATMWTAVFEDDSLRNLSLQMLFNSVNGQPWETSATPFVSSPFRRRPIVSTFALSMAPQRCPYILLSLPANPEVPSAPPAHSICLCALKENDLLGEPSPIPED